jgi:hypothetical protein
VAGRIVYLEVDDEITSAAARIRDAEAERLALVLPYGSRVATSRINFRLLSRDAMTHDKRVSIVAGDAATRALAASAGLPVFATVAEYESAEGKAEAGPSMTAGAGASAVGAAASPAPGPGAPMTTDDTPDEGDGTLGLIIPAAATAATAATAGGTSSSAGGSSRAAASSGAAASSDPMASPADTVRTARMARPAPYASAGTVGAGATGSSLDAPASPFDALRRRVAGAGIRTPWLIGGGILVLAIVLAGIGAYILLPSASIVVTPQPEAIGPIDLTVVADPNATQPDPTGHVVPADRISIPVAVAGTFDATGTRVQLTNATGTVRFENRDPTSTNRIAAGSIVKTTAGVRFRTNDSVTVPRAELVGLTIFPARASVDVTAVDGGPDGNVDSGEIVIVPANESPLFLKVTNQDPTTGGTSQEFKRVTKQDVDAAMANLNASLQAKFQDSMSDPSLVPGGETVFPTSGVLGDTTPTVAPDSLVGKEVPTFDLGLSSTGTVLAVDPTPVTSIARQQLAAAVDPDHRMVEGSTDIEVGDAIISGQNVSFPVTARAQQIAVLDAATLKKLILGKPIAEARAILDAYGVVDLTVSPDWSGSVPGFDSRVDLTVRNPVPITTPSPSLTPRPTARPPTSAPSHPASALPSGSSAP